MLLTPEQKLEALERIFLNPRDIGEVRLDRMCAQWKAAKAVLDPPKPLGFIDPDAPDSWPEVGTVYDSLPLQYHFMRISRGGLFFWIWDTESKSACQSCYTIETWNREAAPDVTAVHPPAAPERAKVRLKTAGDRVEMSTTKNFSVSLQNNEVANIRDFAHGIYSVLKAKKDSNGAPLIDVEVLQ